MIHAMKTPATPSRIGLALGSGSARGLAHIGVLRALAERGLQVGCLAGTSMGALVGALAASGKVDDLEKAFRSMDWRGIVALLDPVFPRSGLIDGRKVERFLQDLLPSQYFDDLPTPFQAVCTDILSGTEVVLSQGRLVEAIHASFAVPGIFTPLRHEGHILVDGGLVNPVPVSTVRHMGASFVIAVDLNHDIVEKRMATAAMHTTAPLPSSSELPFWMRVRDTLKTTRHPVLQQLVEWLAERDAVPLESEGPPIPGIFEILLASVYITQSRLTRINLLHDAPDLLIQPPLGDIRFMEFDRASEIIEIGYEAARQALSECTNLPTQGAMAKPIPISIEQ